jgi:hypothetical protein
MMVMMMMMVVMMMGTHGACGRGAVFRRANHCNRRSCGVHARMAGPQRAQMTTKFVIILAKAVALQSKVTRWDMMGHALCLICLF